MSEKYVEGDLDSSLEAPAMVQRESVASSARKLADRYSLLKLDRSAIKIVGGILGVLVLISLLTVLLTRPSSDQKDPTILDKAANYTVGTLPVDQDGTGAMALGNAERLTINGQLRANSGLVITPTAQPETGIVGQVYFDQDTRQPYFYDGDNFISLVAPTPVSVTSLGGVSGIVGLGNGVQITNGQLRLTDAILQAAAAVNGTTVSSVQGQSGAIVFSGGNGIAINGTTVTNTGLLSLGGAAGDLAVGRGISVQGGALLSTVSVEAGTSNLVITDDGNGNYTISDTTGSNGFPVNLGPTVAQSDSTNNTSINIDKVSTGDFLRFAVNGSDAFVVDQSGVITAGTIGYSQVTGAPATTVTSLGGSSGAISLGTGLTIASNVLTNAGITSFGGTTGDVTVGTGLGYAGNSLTNTGVVSITGTINQINASASAGNVTLSLPQDIATTSSPSFTNLTLAGTLGVTGTTTLGGALNTTGNASFGGTLTANGAVNLSSTLSVTGNTSLQNTAVNGTTTISSILSVGGATTLSSTLGVAAAATFGSSVDIQGGNLTLGVSGTTAGVLNFANSSNSNLTTFSSLAPSGSGTANVQIPSIAGGTTDQVCLLSLGNCIGTGSMVTSTGGQIGYIPVYDSQQNLTSSNIFRSGTSIGINTSTPGAFALNVQGGNVNFSGSSAVGGNLDVTGLATLNGNTSVSGTSTFTVGSGATSLGGTLGVTGATTLSTLSVSGTSAFNGNVSINGTSTLTVGTGATSLGGTLAVGGTTTLGGVLNVSAGTGLVATFSGRVSGADAAANNEFATLGQVNSAVGGAAGNYIANSTSLQTADFNITGSGQTSSFTTGSLTVSANATVGGTLGITGLTTLNGGATIAGVTSITGATTINTTGTASTTIGNATSSFTLASSGLNVSAAGALSGVTGFSQTSGNFAQTGTGTFGTGTGAVALNGATTINSTATITGNTSISGASTLTVGTGATSFGGTLTVAGLTSLNSGVNVTGASTLAGNVSVTGTSTFTVGSGAVTLGSLGTGIVQSNASGVLSSGTIDRNGSLLTGQTSVANGGTGATTAAGARTNLGAAVSGANNDITSLSAVTSVGSTGASLTLQGNGSSVFTATSGGFSTSLGFAGPTANVSYLLPTAAAGTYNICTSIGNCAGAGSGVTTAGGTTGTLALFSGSQSIGNSIVSQSGSTVSVGGTLAVNTIAPTAAMLLGVTGQNLTMQGAAVSISSTAGGFTNTLSFATPSGSSKNITVPNASGTVAVSATGPLTLDANGNLTCATCTTSGGGAGGAVDSLNAINGAVTLQGTTNQVTVTNDSGTRTITLSLPQDINTSSSPTFSSLSLTNNLSVTNAITAGSISSSGTLSVTGAATANTFNGLTLTANATGFSLAGGTAIRTVNVTANVTLDQNLSTTSSPTFSALSLTSALTVANGGTGATTAAGARTNLGAAASGANSDITSITGLTTALSPAQGGTGVNGSAAANGRLLIGNGTGYTLANLTQGSGISITNGAGSITVAVDSTICTTAGNCAGAGSGVTTTGGTTGTIALFTGAQAIGNSILSQSGATVTVAGTLAATNLQGNGSGVTDLNASNLASGTVPSARVTGSYTGITGTGALAAGSIATGFGIISTSNNITTTAALQGNSLSIGAGTFTVNATGAITAATGITSSGTITFSSLNAAGIVKTNASGVLSTGTVALGTETTGNYVATLGTLTGLTTTGNTGEGSTPTLSVNYGSTANTAAQGNTAFTFTPAGNLTGSLSGTAGAGFTTTTLSIVDNPTFSGLVTANLGLTVSGATSITGVTTINTTGTATTNIGNTTGGLTVAGPVTLSGLNADGLVQTNASGTLSTGAVDRNSSTYFNNALSAANGGTGVNGSTAANGRLLIGNGTGYSLANLTQGSGITITNGVGSITIATDSTVCTTAGNCASAGGGVTTAGGTTGTIALFTGAQAIGDSILSQSGATVTVAGTLAATNLQGNGSGITDLNASNLTSGTVPSARIAGSYTGITGTGALAAGSIATGFGVISTGNNITTTAGLQGNTLSVGGGTFAVNALGAVTGATGITSSGTVTFSGLATGIVKSGVGGVLSAGTVTLGTETTGNYVGSLGTLTGLTTTGNTGEGSTPTLSVNYGSTANTAAQGNTTFTCPSGTGNLSGTGNTITIGAGGTCNSLTVVNSPTFTGLISANGGLAVANGQTFTNAGATLNTAVILGNFATGGVIGTAIATVDGATTFNIGQTTAAQTLSLPAPTATTAGRIVNVNSTGTASFVMHGATIPASQGRSFMWNGATWTLMDNAVAGTGISVTGNSISTTAATSVTNDTNITGLISSNVLTLGFTGTLAVARGGTGASDASTARVNLGAASRGANSDITSITGLTTALSVGQGGTGSTSYTTNGVIYSDGTRLISTAASTGAQCLISTGAGVAPTWGSCLNGTDSGVTSVNSFTGAVTINGTANQVNVNNATNTVTLSLPQDINTTSAVSFGRLSVVTATNPGVGSALIFANNTNASPTGNLIDVQTGGVSRFTVSTTGNVVATGSVSSVGVNSGSGLIQGTGGLTVGGSVTLSGLNSAGIVQTNASGVLSTSTIDRNSTLLTGQTSIANGGTGSNTASGARTNLGAAASGANSDITSLTGLTTALSVPQGGTGATTLTSNGILFGNGANAIQATAAANDSILFTSATGVPSLGQTLPAVVQGNITRTGALTTGSIASGFGTISTANNITTTAVIQGGTVTSTGVLGGNSLTINSGVFAVSSTGAVTAATGITSSGTITFSGLATGIVKSGVGGVLGVGTVALGTETTGSYVANIGTVTGLTLGGTTGAGSVPTLSVNYGSTANTAAQGNTTFTCPSGTGNLSGTGNTITIGTGGTCNSLTVVNSPTFTGLITANGGLTVANGQTLTNAGATLNTAINLANFTSNSVIGTAAATVDSATTININQTTIGRTLSLPNPTNTTPGRIVYVNNTGTIGFTMHAASMFVGEGRTFMWNGAAWTLMDTTVAGPGLLSSGSIISSTAPTSVTNDTNITGSISSNILTLGFTGTLAVSRGGTGASDASTARVNLGAASRGANSDITSLTGLSTALSVGQGGTGSTSYTTNGVIYSDGTRLISTAASTGAQCLVSTGAGVAPTWGSCTTGTASGVSSVNTFTGAVSIVGTTNQVLVNNATNTVTLSLPQDINVTSAVSFGRLSVVTATNPGAGSALIFANNTNASPTGNLIDVQTGGVSRFNVAASGAVVGTFSGRVAGSDAVNNNEFVSLGQANSNYQAAGTYAPGTAASYIQNGTGQQASANFNISGTGVASALQAGSLDTASAGALILGGTNATSIGLIAQTFAGSNLYVGATSVPGGVVNGRLTAISGATSQTTFVARAIAGQTVNILETQDSTGSCLFRVNQAGNAGTCEQSSASTNSLGMTYRSGNVSGATSNSGAVTIKSGNSTTSGNTGGINLLSGDAISGSSGNITIDSGSASGTAGSIQIGSTNANGVSISRTGVTTTVNGSLTVSQSGSFSGLVAANGGLTVANLQTLTNAGASLNTAISIANLATGGAIGTAAATVNSATTFNVSQTTAGQTLTLPSPTTTTAGRIVYVNNVGTSSFTMYGVVIAPAKSQQYMWNGTAWTPTSVDGAGAGVTSVTSGTNVTGSITGNVLTLGWTGTLAVADGGTGASDASTARVNLGAAARGANSDITSLTGLTTALSVGQGGTGATTLTQYGVLFGNGAGAVQASAVGSTGQCLLGNTGAAPTWGSCAGASGGATSVGALDGGTLNANGASITSGVLYLQAASASYPGLVTTGTQTLAGAKTFSSTVNVNGALSLGVASSANGSITFRNATNANTVTFTSAATGTSYNLTLPLNSGNNGQCLEMNGTSALTFGNCGGGTGGQNANKSLSNLNAPTAINQNLLAGTAGGINLGSSTLPFGTLNLSGTSATPGTNNFTITGAATAARTITLPDVSGTVCLSTSTNCGTVTGDGGVTTVGGIDTQTKSANGAVISGANIYLQSADASFPGLVTTGAQTLAGAKTFTGAHSINNTSSISAATGVALSVQGASGQNIAEFKRNGDGATVARFDATGNLHANGAYLATTIGQTHNVSGLSLTNSNVTSTAATTIAQNIQLFGTNNANANANNITGANFANVTPRTNNTFTAIATGTGFNNLLTYNGTSVINGLGQLNLSQVTNTLGLANGGTGATSFNTNGIVYSNGTALASTGAGTTGQCLLAATGSAPTWGSCGGGGTVNNLQDAYVGTTGGTPELTLDSTRGALTVRDNATPISGNLLEVQNNAGTRTYLGVSTSGLTVQNANGNAMVFDSTTNTFRVYENVASPTNFASISYAGGVATFAASSGTTQIGNGSGNVTANLTGASDIYSFNKTYTAAAAYSLNDFTIQRTLTGGANALTGSILNVQDMSTGTASAPNVLRVNQNNTSATGNLILAQTGGTTDRFRVTTAGNGYFSGTLQVAGLASCTSIQTSAAGLMSCGAAGSGVTTVGALDGGTANANGATITSSTIYLQSASASVPGLVNTVAQTFAGDKTFNGVVNIASSTDTISTTINSIRRDTAQRMQLDSQGGIILNIDTNNNDADSTFSIRKDTSATDLLTLTQDGRLGLGNSAPDTRLKVGSSATSTSDEIIRVESQTRAGIQLFGDSSDGAGEPGGAYLQLLQDNGSTMSALQTIQAANQDVFGSAYSGTLSNATLLGTNAAGALQLGTNSNVRMTILSDGRVGVGTNAPEGNFDVRQVQNAQTIITVKNSDAGLGASAALRVSNSNATAHMDSLSVGVTGTGFGAIGTLGADTAFVVAEDNISGGLNLTTIASAPITFATGGHTNERMRINGGGNVSIGNTNNTYRLDVTGDINSSTAYRLNGVAGVARTCSGGQVLQDQTVSGGIVTGGTCALVSGGGSGVTTVGAIDSQTASANGAVISGTTIYLQSASALNAGLVNTAAQTFAGDKTFNGQMFLSGSRNSGDGLFKMNGTLTTNNLHQSAMVFQPTLQPGNNFSATGVYIQPTYASTTGLTISETSGLTIATPSKTGTGTITNSYQLKINDPGTNATNNYAIYVAAGNSVFNNGVLTVGSSTAQTGAKLLVDTDPGENQVALSVWQEDTTNNNNAVNIINAGTGASFYVGDDGTTTDATPFLIDNDGNVAIGHSNPNSIKLNVYKNTTNAASNSKLGSFYVDNITNLTTTNNSVALYAGNSAQPTIGTTNNGVVVGLQGQVLQQGAGTLFVALGVDGGIALGSSNGNLSNGMALQASSPTRQGGTGTLSNAYGLMIKPQKQGFVTNGYGVYQEGASDLNYFQGNVGIGTETPSTYAGDKLTVTGSDVNSVSVIVKNTQVNGNALQYFINGSGQNMSVGMYGNGTDSYLVNRAFISAGFTTPGLNVAAPGATGDIRFLTGGNLAVNEKMRITSTGNVGIGDNNPTSKLSVYTANSGTSAIGTLQGSYTGVYSNANAAITNMTGSFIDTELLAGTATNQTALDIYSWAASGTTVANQYGIKIDLDNAGAAGNRYHLYISPPGGGSGGLDYGIYQGGSMLTNYFQGTVKIDTLITPTLSGAKLIATSAEVTTALRIGNATNGVDLSGSSPVSYRGSARPTKKIMLNAEYTGAVLDAGSGANNQLIITSGYNATDRMNYYKGTTTQATNQSYDVVVQVPIPADFDGFASTNPIRISTYTSNLANGTLTMEVRDSGNTVRTSGGTFVSVTPTATGAWQVRDPGTITGTYTAGDYMTVRVRMQSPTSGDVRIGNIYMDYFSKF